VGINVALDDLCNGRRDRPALQRRGEEVQISIPRGLGQTISGKNVQKFLGQMKSKPACRPTPSLTHLQEISAKTLARSLTDLEESSLVGAP
jgi:hypothetical protein